MNPFIHITFGTLLLTATTFTTSAQSTVAVVSDQNIVRISEGDLTTLTKTLKKYKARNTVLTANEAETNENSLAKNNYELTYLRNRVTKLEQLLAQSRMAQNNYTGTQNSSNYATTDRYTQRKLDELSNLIQQMEAKNTPAPVIVTIPDATRDTRDTEVIVQPNTAVPSPNNQTNTDIQQKIDSLYTVIEANKVPETKNYTNDFDALQKKLLELQNEMATKKTTPTNYEVLKSKYANYSQNIYFANNSKTISPSANQVIDELLQILETNDHIDVIVKGFASDNGNPSYNEKLSMQRTEEVKRTLMIKGIHPTRVLTQYHGIDYKATDANNARRVETSLLVRK